MNARITGFTFDTLMEAGKRIFGHMYLDEIENSEQYRSRTQPDPTLKSRIPEIEPQDTYVVIGEVAKVIGMVQVTWGVEVWLAFYHAGIPEDQHACALGDLLMSCIGHGISLQDDYSSFIAKATEILKVDLSKHPSTDMRCLNDLAMTYAELALTEAPWRYYTEADSVTLTFEWPYRSTSTMWDYRTYGGKDTPEEHFNAINALLHTKIAFEKDETSRKPYWKGQIEGEDGRTRIYITVYGERRSESR
jgi:hypothetical protein